MAERSEMPCYPLPFHDLLKARFSIGRDVRSIRPDIRNDRELPAMQGKTQILVWIMALGFLDAVIPLFPILAIVLVHVVLNKPDWFMDWVKVVYGTR